jgi:hypothetical protein
MNLLYETNPVAQDAVLGSKRAIAEHTSQALYLLSIK